MSDGERQPVYRILDASANRAGEGLRSLEEVARFVLDDPGITSELKSLRHQLAAAIAHFPRSLMLSARDTVGDVGTNLSEPSESVRRGIADVVAAAASRTGQSLRVLEEYGKTIDGRAAAEIEQIRYRCYTVFASLETRLPGTDRRRRLADSRLYVLTDAGKDETSYAASVQFLFDHGVDIIQLRDRVADDRTLISRARVGTAIADKAGRLFIVNDRADLALASGADGVHVGQEELPAQVARQILGEGKLIGVSTHSIAQAREAVTEGADYIGCGPVFPGQTKSFDDYVGTAFLREVTTEIELPAFAIGGIDLSNVDEVVAAGSNRIAVTGAIRDADDPQAAISDLQDWLRGNRQSADR